MRLVVICLVAFVSRTLASGVGEQSVVNSLINLQKRIDYRTCIGEYLWLELPSNRPRVNNLHFLFYSFRSIRCPPRHNNPDGRVPEYGCHLPVSCDDGKS